jgi:hypothetical protein
MKENITFDNAVELIKSGVILEYRHRSLDEYDEHVRDQLSTNWVTWLPEFPPDYENLNVEWRIKDESKNSI